MQGPIITSCVLALLTATAAGQKPSVPPGGFATQVADHMIEYGDDYATLARLTWPQGTPPSGGWPLVLLVHGLTGGHLQLDTEAAAIASEGYAVWTYSVRGQGSAIALNPDGYPDTRGFTFWGSDEKYDMVEQVAEARTLYPDDVAEDRLAVVGFSQGAVHAWIAAAYSEQPIWDPGKHTGEPDRGSPGPVDPSTFPKVDCIVAWNAIPDFNEALVLPGDWLSYFVAEIAGKTFATLPTPPPKVVYDAPLVDLVGACVLAGSSAPLLAVWAAEEHRDWGDLVEESNVPALLFHAYYDETQSPLGAYRHFRDDAPDDWHMHLSTGGHQSPGNAYETAVKQRERLRWLDRWLWDEGAPELEAPIVMAASPTTEAGFAPLELWPHRMQADFAPADVPTPGPRLYLHSGGLQTSEPTALGPRATVHHVVAPGYVPLIWATTANQPGDGKGSCAPYCSADCSGDGDDGLNDRLEDMLAHIPSDDVGFDAAPLAEATELAGLVQVHVVLTPEEPDIHLGVQLRAIVPGETCELVLASNGTRLSGLTPSSPTSFELELGPVEVVLPPGTVIRLVVGNHWLVEHPAALQVRGFPSFDDFSFDVLDGAGAEASWVELPQRSEVRLAITTDVLDLPWASLQPETMQIVGGPARAGDSSVVLGSLSGHGPVAVPPHTLWLQPDALTTTMLGLTSIPDFQPHICTLDANGTGVVTMTPFSVGIFRSSLIGMRYSFASLTYDPSDLSLTGVSNTLDIVLD